MKQLEKICSIALTASLVFLSSCSKDDETKINRTEVLTSNSWVLSKVEMTYEGQTIDATSQFNTECQKDNSIVFTKEGKYEELEGTNDCNHDSEGINGTWAWNTDETVILVTFEEGYTSSMKVVSMTSNSMKYDAGVAQFDLNGDGTEEKVEMTVTVKAK